MHTLMQDLRFGDPSAPQGPQLHDHRAPDARHLHRRQHRDVQRRPVRAAEAAAVRRLRAHRPPLQQLSERGRAACRRRRAGLLRSADGRAGARRPGAVPPRGRDLRRRERRRAADQHLRATPSFFRMVGVAADRRPAVHGRRRRARQGRRSALLELRLLAAQVRRRGRRSSARRSG